MLHAGEPRAEVPRDPIDAQGRTLLPGMIDAHGHVMELGLDALQLDLVGTSSLDESAAAAARPMRLRTPKRAGSSARAGTRNCGPRNAFRRRPISMRSCSDRPVVLERVDGHALVANSAAMKAAGVTRATPAPAGRRIENGLFVDNAKALIDKAIPAPTRTNSTRRFRKGAGDPARLRRHRRRIDEHVARRLEHVPARRGCRSA